jgi:DNA-binding transcriptional LysR family regulator
MNFNKAEDQAVDRLHHAQSRISFQIHALEEELGVELIDRLGKKVRLTETDERLLGYLKRLLT